MWNLSTCDCESSKPCTVDKYLNAKNCSCEKLLFRKFVLVYEDEILNTTENSLDAKKTTCK